MIEEFKKGIYFSLGFIFTFGVLFGIVYAVGFHNPNEIISGTFTGNYNFSGEVEFESGVGFGKSNSLFQVEINGTILSDGHASQIINGFADDTAQSFDPPQHRGFCMVSTNSERYFFGFCSYNSIVTIQAHSGFDVHTTAGTLTGTTGTDGETSIRMDGGRFYIENREGTARNYAITFLNFAY